jgi:hypothetical protein
VIQKREDFKRLIADWGVSLAPLHIDEVALLREDALKAIELVRSSQLAILGGDVYFCHGQRLEFARCGWHADPKPLERLDTFLCRSWDEAEKYIKSFPDPSDADALFGIVVATAF